MLTAGAVCPHPPLLVPETTGGHAAWPEDTELTRLRQACDAAVAAVVATRPDVFVLVGGAGRTTRYPPEAAGSLAGFGVPFAIGDGPPVLPLSLTIGRWLLARAGAEPAGLHAIAADATAEECMLTGAGLAALAPRVAILAMGDGPARRARRAPGAIDADADRYDKLVANALAACDAGQLAELDPGQDDDLFIAGRAAWQVLAGAVLADADIAATDIGDARFAARLHYAAAPFEVSYFVATWLLAQ